MREHQLHADFINGAMAQTLPGLFAERIKRSPDRIAYQQYNIEDECWQTYTWQDMGQLVARWRAVLLTENLQHGERVAIMLKNSIEWVCFEQAAQSLGLVVISLYTTDTPQNIAFILSDAQVQLLLVNDVEQWQRLHEQGDDLSHLKRVWCLQKTDTHSKKDDDRLRCIASLLPAEAESYTVMDIGPRDLATIIYTSGTTGRPKGVMLSHHNILANAEAVQQQIPAFVEDVFLSFLPLAHAFERTVEYILPMMAGSRVAYARSIELLRDDLLVIKPTVFVSAPRLYEKIYTAIQHKIADDRLKQKLFSKAVSLGWQKFEANQQRGPALNPLQYLVWKLLYTLVSKKVLSRLGGRVRVAVTGAAPLSAKVSRFFLGLGLPLIEGYGLTEASPVVSSNRFDNNLPGSVGVPLPGVEVTIADNGELLVRSEAVMLGYWQQEEKTRQTIDAKGWLHTGDLAEIVSGVIYIKGRLKEILVTSTGEKVPPADMEMMICLDPLFDQAMVVGEGKPYLAALIVLNRETWTKLAMHLALDPEDKVSLHHPKVVTAVLANLAEDLSSFPVYAQIHAVNLTLEPWTIENNLLTPTLKIKRNALQEKFHDEIKALYRGHEIIE